MAELPKEKAILIGDDNIGQEKVKRLKEFMPGCILEAFYSDSHKDLPLARIAEQACKVTYNKVRPWPRNIRFNFYPLADQCGF